MSIDFDKDTQLRNIKVIRQSVIKVYPNLKNEIGFICTESIKNYIKTHKYEI